MTLTIRYADLGEGVLYAVRHTDGGTLVVLNTRTDPHPCDRED